MQRQRTRTLAVHQMQDQTSCRPVCVRRACHRCQVQTSLHRLFCGMLAQCVPKRQPQTFARRLDVARRRRCGTNLGPRTAGVVGKRVCVSCRAHMSDGARLWSHVDVVTHLRSPPRVVAAISHEGQPRVHKGTLKTAREQIAKEQSRARKRKQAGKVVALFKSLHAVKAQ